MAFRVAPDAERDIQQIYQASVDGFGMDHAEDYLSGLDKVLHFVSDFPRAVRERVDIVPPVRVHPYRAHMVVYEIADDGAAVILRVRHGREDWISDPL